MSSVKKYRPHYTYQDYLQWEGRWELIDGIPYAMSPAPGHQHQWISSQLSSLFVQALKNCKQCKVYQPIDWRIAEDTVVQPDLSIICKPITHAAYLDFAPILTVEILSSSTALKDRREKFEIYEKQGVKYYMIIDPAFKKIEIFENINAQYQPVAVTPTQFDFILEDNCHAPIDFEGIFE